MSDVTREIRCKGLGVSEGIVIGQVLRMHDGTQHVYHWRLDEAAWKRTAAVSHRGGVGRQSGAVDSKNWRNNALGKDHAYIFDAHLLLLQDEKLIGDIEQHIVEKRAMPNGPSKSSAMNAATLFGNQGRLSARTRFGH